MILPVNTKPSLINYPYFSYYVSVLEGRQMKIDGIMANHFLTLYLTPKINQIGFREFNYFIKSVFLTERFSIDRVYPVQHVKQHIDKGHYLSLVLCNENEYYGFHDYMFYGYDDKKQIFYCLGYSIVDNSHKFCPFELSYELFCSLIPPKNVKTGYEKNLINTHAFWLKEDYITESPNQRKIKWGLVQYVHSLPPFFFNIHLYRFFISKLRKNKNSTSGKFFIDIIHFRTMYEHKCCVYCALCFLNLDDDLMERYKFIQIKAEKLMNLVLKYNYIQSDDLFERICNYTLEMEDEEKVLLKQVLHHLKRRRS